MNYIIIHHKLITSRFQVRFFQSKFFYSRINISWLGKKALDLVTAARPQDFSVLTAQLASYGGGEGADREA